MDWFQTDPKQWAATQFGEANLGDKRRTNRLLHLSEQVVGNPSGSFPDITECWADLKAAYRLFDAEEVTFQAVATPHWHRTRACPPGRYLVIGDTTEFDWGPGVEGLAPTGREVTVAEYLETLPVAGTFPLKAVARSEPDRPAEELVPRGYIRLLNGFSEAWLRRSMGAGNAGSGIAIPVSEHDSYGCPVKRPGAPGCGDATRQGITGSRARP